ncbi:MAG: hypothetical protein HY890_03315 [Deltaproteobacteria bacterium]|nr:hypothetical protein [Deltaproteobacteria bacterium]
MDRKKILPVFFVLLSWVVLAGMGATSDIDVPQPDKNFTATVIDDQDVSTRCTNVSWEGKTFFKAQRGKGFISIPFEKVKKAVFVSSAGSGQVNLQVVLKSGEVLAVNFSEDMRFLGKTDFGNYMIFAKNIKEIVFE